MPPPATGATIFRPPTMALVKSMPYATRTAFAIIPPTFMFYLYHTWRGTRPSENINNLFEAVSKVVGLYGLSKLYFEMAERVGVELTMPRTCQTLATIGSIMSTLHYWTASYSNKTERRWGRAFLVISLVSSLTFVRMMYLLLVYNRRLECMTQPLAKGVRGDLNNTMGKALHVPYLTVWIGLVYFTMYMWVREARDLANDKGVLSAAGFVLSAIGAMQAGIHAISTAYPGLRPLDGVSAIIAAMLLGGMQWLPLWSRSPKSRLYLAGFASVLFALLANASVIVKRGESSRRAKL
eukprot:TRINITY_DN10569_c0_g1_i7.p1 TRINITY_DN10569_c0_g1~~TRINITY_DN10569_c0_g1_i7.p1  ORF type:complete len:312 (+),score=22.52 TRINITY_DN10569_c0_g1_i7:54-938(+)